jgi:hypothetical protein
MELVRRILCSASQHKIRRTTKIRWFYMGRQIFELNRFIQSFGPISWNILSFKRAFICATLVFDSPTDLAGLATKLSVLSRSRLSFTQPAKMAQPAKFFCGSLTVHQLSQKGQNVLIHICLPQKCLLWRMDYGLDVKCNGQCDTLSIGSI